jgi:hypothetical protein
VLNANVLTLSSRVLIKVTKSVVILKDAAIFMGNDLPVSAEAAVVSFEEDIQDAVTILKRLSTKL